MTDKWLKVPPTARLDKSIVFDVSFGTYVGYELPNGVRHSFTPVVMGGDGQIVLTIPRWQVLDGDLDGADVVGRLFP